MSAPSGKRKSSAAQPHASTTTKRSSSSRRPHDKPEDVPQNTPDGVHTGENYSTYPSQTSGDDATEHQYDHDTQQGPVAPAEYDVFVEPSKTQDSDAAHPPAGRAHAEEGVQDRHSFLYAPENEAHNTPLRNQAKSVEDVLDTGTALLKTHQEQRTRVADEDEHGAGRDFYVCRAYGRNIIVKPLAVVCCKSPKSAARLLGDELNARQRVRNGEFANLPFKKIDTAETGVVAMSFFDESDRGKKGADSCAFGTPDTTHGEKKGGYSVDSDGEDAYEPGVRNLYICKDHHVNSIFNPTSLVVARSESDAKRALDKVLDVLGLKTSFAHPYTMTLIEGNRDRVVIC